MEGHSWIKFIFGGENHIPLVCLALNRTGLDGSNYLAMELNLDTTYFREVELHFDDLKPALWIGEGVIAVSRFKSGIAWFLPVLDPSEEVIHRLVNTGEYVLQDLTVDVFELWSVLFNFR